MTAAPSRAIAQVHEPAPAEQVDEAAVAEGHTAEGEHEAGWLDLVARLFNFAVLAGTLVYFLRSPIAGYLSDRGRQVRSDLTAAAEMRKTATEQLAEIDRKLAALPGELERLKAQGLQEIAAEEARIREAADAERRRLLEQTRREIELQYRVARRDLLRDAADLSVGMAADRIRNQITEQDQLRLTDRYVTRLRGRIGRAS